VCASCVTIKSEPNLHAFSCAVRSKLGWFLKETAPEGSFASISFLDSLSPADGHWTEVVELGPRLSFTSPWSTNAVSMLAASGVPLTRLERYRRLRFRCSAALDPASWSALLSSLYDRMTECVLPEPLASFAAAAAAAPEGWYTVPVMQLGETAVRTENEKSGLGLDDWDVQYYTKLFAETIGRNPTNVELFDISQSNSEHSRHWFFKGKMVLDGQEQEGNLMDVVAATLTAAPENSVIAFADNSSVIKGFPATLLYPQAAGEGAAAAAPQEYSSYKRTRHLLLTAETHNFPCGVAPYPGAETGTGGRIRDTQATGSGSLVAAGTAGYCVGNLQLPGYKLPWEDESFMYPPNMASPLQIQVDASNGASDYGNKFGEPVVAGFTRSYGARLTNGERREWIKPIMFSAGIGFLDAAHAVKGTPEAGMVITKIGGPAYRIGIGGSAASSMVQGENKEHLDFNAVQRGDAEMEQKMNRVIRACVELGEKNPIISVHDQGAGGNCNVLKEICEPLGGRIDIRALPVGDPTMSVLELWGSEYQENNALLLHAKDKELFSALCARERVPHAFVGLVTDDGQVVVVDSADGSTPVDMNLDAVLGNIPRKTFKFARVLPPTAPLALPESTTVATALNRVMRLTSVGSKRFLTNKVDRSVTGLIAQQQCVGPLHTPLADCAVVASSYFSTTGVASSIGEAPLKGLLSPGAQARMTVAEAVTNLMGAPITRLRDVKCSANWMWAAKLAGEGAALWDTATAMRDVMLQLGIAVDGGKDSLSMAAHTPDREVVKAPGQLVVSLYAPCVDITRVATPDFKAPGASRIFLLDASVVDASGAGAAARLGGSALAQVYSQLGDDAPDLGNAAYLGNMFAAVNTLVARGMAALAAPFDAGAALGQTVEGAILPDMGEDGAALHREAGSEAAVLALHDRSDGGALVAVMEMAFAGNCGLQVQLPAPAGASALAACFAEEPGVFVEVPAGDAQRIQAWLQAAGVHVQDIGATTADGSVSVSVAGETVLSGSSAGAVIPGVEGQPSSPPTAHWSTALASSDDDALLRSLSAAQWRDVWECTSFQLELKQSHPSCVAQEQHAMVTRGAPPFALTYAPAPTSAAQRALLSPSKPLVAVLREEGSNGDREMAASFHMAGFQCWDVTMSDLLEGRVTLDRFRGLAAVGGFSYADVLGSARGWAGSIKFNTSVAAQVNHFFNSRQDTFSLGVCNGCQLFGVLGLVPFPGGSELIPTPEEQPIFTHNASGRYESRFVSVAIAQDTPAMMLAGMGGSCLGVWVAHGEGRVSFKSGALKQHVLASGLAPLLYVDDAGAPTEAYPMNPNGSASGIAGLCSPDGRHLAMMPHPERATLAWQWPHMPQEWTQGSAQLAASPWLRMFQNAFEWCAANEAASM